MEISADEKIPVAPEPEEKHTFQASASKDDLYAYILKSPGEVPSLLKRKIVPQQLVDASFLNRLAASAQTAPLELFLGYAKESLLYLGLLTIVKGATFESTLLVINKLKTIPPRAPFDLLKNFNASPEDYLKITELLIQKGWDPKTKSSDGDSLVAHAVKLGHKPDGPLCKGLMKLGVSL